MKRKCDRCGYSGNSNEFEDGECPFCGHKIPEGDPEIELESPAESSLIALGQDQSLDFGQLFITFKNILFSPMSFFREIRQSKKVMLPIVIGLFIQWCCYGILLMQFDDIAAGIRQFLEQASGIEQYIDVPKLMTEIDNITKADLFLQFPLQYFFKIGILSFIFHFIGMFISSKPVPLSRAFQSIAYLQFLGIFILIPYLMYIVPFYYGMALFATYQKIRKEKDKDK